MKDHPTPPENGDCTPASPPIGSTLGGHAVVGSVQDMTVDIWGPRRCKPRSAGWMG